MSVNTGYIISNVHINTMVSLALKAHEEEEPKFLGVAVEHLYNYSLTQEQNNKIVGILQNIVPNNVAHAPLLITQVLNGATVQSFTEVPNAHKSSTPIIPHNKIAGILQYIILNNGADAPLLISQLLNGATIQPFAEVPNTNKSSTPIIPQITESSRINDLSTTFCPLLDLPLDLKRPLLLSVGRIDEIVRLLLVCKDFNNILKGDCDPFLKCQSNLLKGIYLSSEDQVSSSLNLGSVSRFCFADEKLVLSDRKEKIKIWDIKEKKCLGSLKEESCRDYSIFSLTSTNKKLVSVYSSWKKRDRVKLWDIKKKICLFTHESDLSIKMGIYANKMLFLGHKYGNIEIWDVKSKKLLRTVSNLFKFVSYNIDQYCNPDASRLLDCMAYANDRLFVGSLSGEIKVLDTKTLQFSSTLTQSLEQHPNGPPRSAFLACVNGKLFAGSEDGRIRAWDLETGILKRIKFSDGKFLSGSAICGDEKSLSIFSFDPSSSKIRKYDFQTDEMTANMAILTKIAKEYREGDREREWVFGVPDSFNRLPQEIRNSVYQEPSFMSYAISIEAQAFEGSAEDFFHEELSTSKQVKAIENFLRRSATKKQLG